MSAWQSAEPQTTALRLVGVSKSFPSHKRRSERVAAVAPVDLELRQGEFVAIVGPSGCGKSTLLRVAAGLLVPSSGVVEQAGAGSFVFQEPALLPWRNIERNCALPLELSRVAKQERQERVKDALELVKLERWARYHPHQLSGGMKMRVALARALVADAEIVYLDEPFSAIDELTREELNDQLLRLWMERRFAALFITHSISEAIYLAERVLVMSPRPGRFLGEVRVPFPYPRSPSLRTSDDFVHVQRQLVELLGANASEDAVAGGRDGTASDRQPVPVYYPFVVPSDHTADHPETI